MPPPARTPHPLSSVPAFNPCKPKNRKSIANPRDTNPGATHRVLKTACDIFQLGSTPFSIPGILCQHRIFVQIDLGLRDG